MSLRNTSGHGGRHIRKSTKRVKKKQPLFPKNTANRIQQRNVANVDEDEVGDDYVNIGSRHKLTYLRYPGAGKRPPPKPKRVQDLGTALNSPPPSPLRVPVPPRPQPRIKKPNSPSQSAESSSLDMGFRPPPSRSQKPARPPPPNPSKSLPFSMRNTPLPIKSSPKKSNILFNSPPLWQGLPPNRVPQDPIVVSMGRIVPPPPGSAPLPPARAESSVYDAVIVSPKYRPVESDFGDHSKVLFGSNGLVNGADSSSKSKTQKFREQPKLPVVSNGFIRGAVSPLAQPPTTSSKPAKQPLLPPPTAKPRKSKPVENDGGDDLDNIYLNSSEHFDVHPTFLQQESLYSNLDSSGEWSNTSKPKPLLPKAPFPKPRLKKTSSSSGESSHLENPSLTYQNMSLMQSEKGQSSKLAPPVRPVPRARLGSRGANQTDQTAVSGLKRSNEALSPSPPAPRSRLSKGQDTQIQVRDREGEGAGGKEVGFNKNPSPVPRKRVNKDLNPGNHQLPTADGREKEGRGGEGERKGTTPPKQSLKTRRKGGGIRVPLWTAPPPPLLSPSSTLVSKNRKQTTPIFSPSPTPSTSLFDLSHSSSFVLIPPFQSSGHHSPSSSPIPSDMERPVVRDQVPPILFTRSPIASSPQPRSKSPHALKLDFEESLYENKTFSKRKMNSQQPLLPMSIVQELQTNFRKQVAVRW